MKKILFLTPQLPFPPISGGVVHSWRIVEYLSRKYSLHLVSLLKGGNELDESDFLKSLPLDKYRSFKVSAPRFSRDARNLLKSYLEGVPLSIYRNSVNEVSEYIQSVLNDCDCMFIDHYLMYQYVPKSFTGKVIVNEHNAEYIMWSRSARHERNLVRKAVMFIESYRIKQYELQICREASKVLCISRNDKDALVGAGADHRNLVVLSGVGDETCLSAPALECPKAENALLYIGTLTWDANIDGLLWFIREAWPTLSRRYPSLKFYIVGKDPDLLVQSAVREEENIVLAGFVQNLEDYYSRCRVFVSPLRYGSGVKIKNLNAMARGIPVVTTSVGIEGIDAHDQEEYIHAESPQEFISGVSALLDDDSLWACVSSKSRSLIREKYSWEAVRRVLDEVVDECE